MDARVAMRVKEAIPVLLVNGIILELSAFIFRMIVDDPMMRLTFYWVMTIILLYPLYNAIHGDD